jgi:hypothetical protein
MQNECPRATLEAMILTKDPTLVASTRPGRRQPKARGDVGHGLLKRCLWTRHGIVILGKKWVTLPQ